MTLPALAEVLQLSDRQRRLLRWFGYPGFGVVCFLIALYASLPRDRLRERLERELSQDPTPAARLGTGMDVSIGDLGLSLLPPGVTLRNITFKQRNFPPAVEPQDRKAKTYFIESVELRASVLDLLVGARSGRLALEAFGGEGRAQVRLSGSEVTAEVRGQDLALLRVPGLTQAVPLPLGGRLTLAVDFKAAIEPKSQRLITTSSSGMVDVSLEDAVIGDGKAKLTVPGNPFLSQGLTFPRVRLGKVSGRLVIAKGRATMDQVRAKSQDAEATIEGYIELRDPLPQSELHLYLRFRPSAELIKREPTFELLVNGLSQGKRPDGFLGFSIQGSLQAPLGHPSREPPSGVSVRAASLSAPPPAPVIAREPAFGSGALPPGPPAFAPPPPPSPEPPPPPPSGLPPAPSLSSYRPPPGSPPPADTLRTVAPPPPAPAEPAPAEAAAPGSPSSLPPPPTNYPVNQKGE